MSIFICNNFVFDHFLISWTKNVKNCICSKSSPLKELSFFLPSLLVENLLHPNLPSVIHTFRWIVERLSYFSTIGTREDIQVSPHTPAAVYYYRSMYIQSHTQKHENFGKQALKCWVYERKDELFTYICMSTTSPPHHSCNILCTRVRVTWRILIWCAIGMCWVGFSTLCFYHTYILCTYVDF